MANRTREKSIGAVPDKRENGLGGRNGLLEEKMEAKRRYKNNMLINAVIGGRLDNVEKLWKRGADVNAVDEKGRSALKWARFTGNDEIADFLSARGAKENVD